MAVIDTNALRQLSVNERLDLVASIWESLDDERQRLDVPDWHLEIVRERMAQHEAGERHEIPLADYLRQRAAKR